MSINIQPNPEILLTVLHTKEYADLPEKKKKELHDWATSDNWIPQPLDVSSDFESLVLLAEYISSKKGIWKRINPDISILNTVASSVNEIQSNVYNAIYHLMSRDVDSLNGAISQNFIELEKCFSIGAYRATVILAGSVLEAFLLDWLSEIDGIDYFEQPYMVKKTGKNGKTYETPSECLFTYIERIGEIKAPTWMEQKSEAHEIRKGRNLVHAKLNLKSDVAIDKELCVRIIDYLKNIMCTRMGEKESRLDVVCKSLMGSESFYVSKEDKDALEAYKRIMSIK